MISGVVNSKLQGIIRLTLSNPTGQTAQADVVVDSGYDGFLSLTPALIAMLALPWQQSVSVTLADGSSTLVDIFGATVDWNGQVRH